MTAQAERLEPGQTYRCPTCHATIVAVGGELGAWCHGGSRHAVTRMDLVVDAVGDEMPPTPLHPQPCIDCGRPTRGQWNSADGIKPLCPACFGLPATTNENGR